MVDKGDLKSPGPKGPCVFESRWGHKKIKGAHTLENDATHTIVVTSLLKNNIFKMELSVTNKSVKFAYDKGYRVDEKGNVWYNGKQRKLCDNWGRTGGKLYYSFCVRNDEGKPKNVLVHKLQAYQKFGEKIFENGIVVRHLNDNSLDNTYANIEIGTQQDNSMDIPSERRLSHAKHAASFQIKYDADEIKKYHEKSKSYAKTMSKFNITSKGTLYHILNNR